MLLMAVVNHIHTAVESCTSNLVWAQQAQQLHERLHVLRTAIASAEAGAGRSVFFFPPLCHLCGERALWGLNLLSFPALAAVDLLLSPVKVPHGFVHAPSCSILSALCMEFKPTTSCCRRLQQQSQQLLASGVRVQTGQVQGAVTATLPRCIVFLHLVSTLAQAILHLT